MTDVARAIVWEESLRCAGRCGGYDGFPVARSSLDPLMAVGCERLAGRERVSAGSEERCIWFVAALLYRVRCCGNVLPGRASRCNPASVSPDIWCAVWNCGLFGHEPDREAALRQTKRPVTRTGVLIQLIIHMVIVGPSISLSAAHFLNSAATM